MTARNTRDDDPRAEEEAHLAGIESCLQRALRNAEDRLQRYARDVQEQKTYLWQNRAEMDHVEKVNSRESIDQAVMTADKLLEHQKRLEKLRRSPYFGRFDFAVDGSETAEPVYVGIHHFYDEHTRRTRVYDWRAPIATLFYDYETGPARYEAPQGMIAGDIRLKRQFRIKQGRIELMIDSAVNVVDEVLQDELGRTSDEGMKNIVATIQRDQNAIIRDEQAPVLIIQGVAGSGKTSIALHRIAFLLYRFKDTLSSEDILIISPNRVFADYIANVLPELGEESVNEIRMEDLAEALLEGAYRFQSFFEQTGALLERNDDAMRERIERKASPAFLKQLDRYAAHVERNRFVAEDVWIARRLVPAWLLDEIFHKHRAMGSRERIRQVVREAEQKIGIQYNYDLTVEDRRALRTAVKGMLNETSLRKTYRQFYDWLGEPELFRTASRGRLEYADVFPLIYLKLKLESVRSPYRRVKHLLVDEMQDYTPVQYAVLEKLFNCKKTVLGDVSQSINPYSASKADEIKQAFSQAVVVTLNKSYRSSYEITRFAQAISPNPDLEAIERHGEAPRVIEHRRAADERAGLVAMARAFKASARNTLGIVCKTQKQARRVFDTLAAAEITAQLLTEETQSFGLGIVICTAHMAKGLEFDEVIVPGADERTYHTAMDRKLLYVACTRAMHRLTVTSVGPATPFVPRENC